MLAQIVVRKQQGKDKSFVNLTSQKYHGPWKLSSLYLLPVQKTIQMADAYGQYTTPSFFLESLLQILYQKMLV
jgi:hypothetical protein